MEKVYTVREVAESEKLSRNEVTMMVHQGYFPGSYKGGRGKTTSPILIPESAIKAYRASLPRVGLLPFAVPGS